MNIFDNLFIFEIANNHQGSIEHGFKIIDTMAGISKQKNIHAGIKLQYRNLDTFIHRDYIEDNNNKHIKRFLSTRLNDKEFSLLVERIKSQGLLSIVTPFDEQSVDKCLQDDVDIIKIASCSAKDWPLLDAAVSTGKPLIISTGGIELPDIDNLVSFVKHKNIPFAILHCIALYPTPADRAQMSFLERMIKRYPGVPVGYSGHEAPEELGVVYVAAAKGAKILERHVGIGKLNAYSMNPDQTEKWVDAALSARLISFGTIEKSVSKEERESIMSLSRGVFALREIPKGKMLEPKDVFFAMPCRTGQLTSGAFGSYRTKIVTSKNYKKNEAIEEKIQADPMLIIRKYLHTVLGLLAEASIEIRSEFLIELSHHYGIKRFSEVGATIVNVVNKEYCKKIIVLLPGQSNPVHYHKKKAETFQLLWGDLEVTLDGIRNSLAKGGLIEVARGVKHSFASKNGAIFEEISTTHIKDDSYYDDPNIAKLDLLERKTLMNAEDFL